MDIENAMESPQKFDDEEGNGLNEEQEGLFPRDPEENEFAFGGNFHEHEQIENGM